jgi:nitroreductase
MSSATTDVWKISEQNFPEAAPIEAQLRFLLGYAILAPSTRNTQPWRFAVRANMIHLFADAERRQAVADPEGRELYISLGCTLENLLVAAERFGFLHEVTYFPERGNTELVATVAFTPGGTPSPARAWIALDAIIRRRNSNSAYRLAPVPEEVRAHLQACCTESGLRLDLTDDHFFRRWVDELTREADRLEFANPAFRQELGHWIGQGGLRMPGLVSRLSGLVVSRLDLGEPVARQDREVVGTAPLFGLLSSTYDTPLAQVRTGQAFERVWLTATTMGVDVHPMSQTMRLPELRAAMAELLPLSGWMPQHLFCIGYWREAAEFLHHTPRRSVEDVLQQ